jgi:hypothetical protein
MKTGRDPALDTLLELDGTVLVVDRQGLYWVRFSVRRAGVTSARPHGQKYSLTPHGPGNERILGFDNAHAAPGQAKRPHDHKHGFGAVAGYAYRDAGRLIEDFWAAVDAESRKRGVFQ